MRWVRHRLCEPQNSPGEDAWLYSTRRQQFAQHSPGEFSRLYSTRWQPFIYVCRIQVMRIKVFNFIDTLDPIGFQPGIRAIPLAEGPAAQLDTRGRSQGALSGMCHTVMAETVCPSACVSVVVFSSSSFRVGGACGATSHR